MLQDWIELSARRGNPRTCNRNTQPGTATDFNTLQDIRIATAPPQRDTSQMWNLWDELPPSSILKRQIQLPRRSRSAEWAQSLLAPMEGTECVQQVFQTSHVRAFAPLHTMCPKLPSRPLATWLKCADYQDSSQTRPLHRAVRSCNHKTQNVAVGASQAATAPA